MASDVRAAASCMRLSELISKSYSSPPPACLTYNLPLLSKTEKKLIFPYLSPWRAMKIRKLWSLSFVQSQVLRLNKYVSGTIAICMTCGAYVTPADGLLTGSPVLRG
jgi:hypothetical protein